MFSPNPPFFYERARLAPYESSHMFGHRPATVRLAGRKRHARFESSEALAEQPAVARRAVELHRCCARVSRAAALVRQHIDGVARASSAGTKSGSSARSLVLLAPVSRCARLEGPARARRRIKLENRRRKARAVRGSLLSAICQLPAPAPADPPISGFYASTRRESWESTIPRLKYTAGSSGLLGDGLAAPFLFDHNVPRALSQQLIDDCAAPAPPRHHDSVAAPPHHPPHLRCHLLRLRKLRQRKDRRPLPMRRRRTSVRPRRFDSLASYCIPTAGCCQMPPRPVVRHAAPAASRRLHQPPPLLPSARTSASCGPH